MQPDDIDKLFRGGLEGHRTPPPRDLWERLEDELRPPKKRRAAWWPLAIAAVVALLLLAGGAGIWGGAWHRAGRAANPVATRTPSAEKTSQSQPEHLDLASRGLSTPKALSQPATPAARNSAPRNAQAIAQQPLLASTQSDRLSESAEASKAKPENASAVAPRGGQEAHDSRLGQPTTAKQAFVVAQRFSKKTSPSQATRASRPASTLSNADLLARQSATPLPQVAAPDPQSAGSALATTRTNSGPGAPTPSTPTLALATPTDVIEVDVRRGGGPKISLAALFDNAGTPAAANAADAGDPPRRRLLDGVLGKASRVVRTARQGINALQDLPDNLTVQARLGERTVSKTLEL